MSIAAPMSDLTVEQLKKLTHLIYETLGLHFDEKKLYFLSKRVEKRLQATGARDVDDYLFLLTYCDKNGREMQELANLITTNETYMFREFEQLEAFANYCLPELLEAKRARNERKLRIWCAGCSSGEEAYTLAIIALEVFPELRQWSFEITATDIDEHVMAKATAAVYGERSTRLVPEPYLASHFAEVPGGHQVVPSTSGYVQVRKVNLHDRMEMRQMRNYDFVFCRNVLIYFDDLSRKAAVDHFYNALNRGGYIFLGHSESVGRITTAFRLKRFDQHLVYVKD